MLSIRLPLALIFTVLLAIAAYFSQEALSNSTIASFIPSLFVLLTFLFMSLPSLLSALTTPSSQAAQVEQSNKTDVRASRQAHSKPANNGSTATLYVGNLPYKANEHNVKSLFEDVSTVISVRLMKDRKTGRRKGFGFVEVNAGDSEQFISRLNDFEFMDRTIKVRPANDKND